VYHPRREVESLLDAADGRLIGLWDYDIGEQKIVWAQFARGKFDVAGAVAATDAFVRDQLGDARSFSLDSPESRGGRLTTLRKLGAVRH
jgi:hypothetical protein